MTLEDKSLASETDSSKPCDSLLQEALTYFKIDYEEPLTQVNNPELQTCFLTPPNQSPNINTMSELNDELVEDWDSPAEDVKGELSDQEEHDRQSEETQPDVDLNEHGTWEGYYLANSTKLKEKEAEYRKGLEWYRCVNRVFTKNRNPPKYAGHFCVRAVLTYPQYFNETKYVWPGDLERKQLNPRFYSEMDPKYLPICPWCYSKLKLRDDDSKIYPKRAIWRTQRFITPRAEIGSPLTTGTFIREKTEKSPSIALLRKMVEEKRPTGKLTDIGVLYRFNPDGSKNYAKTMHSELDNVTKCALLYKNRGLYWSQEWYVTQNQISGNCYEQMMEVFLHEQILESRLTLDTSCIFVNHPVTKSFMLSQPSINDETKRAEFFYPIPDYISQESIDKIDETYMSSGHEYSTSSQSDKNHYIIDMFCYTRLKADYFELLSEEQKTEYAKDEEALVEYMKEKRNDSTLTSMADSSFFFNDWEAADIIRIFDGYKPLDTFRQGEISFPRFVHFAMINDPEWIFYDWAGKFQYFRQYLVLNKHAIRNDMVERWSSENVLPNKEYWKGMVTIFHKQTFYKPQVRYILSSIREDLFSGKHEFCEKFRTHIVT